MGVPRTQHSKAVLSHFSEAVLGQGDPGTSTGKDRTFTGRAGMTPPLDFHILIPSAPTMHPFSRRHMPVQVPAGELEQGWGRRGGRCGQPVLYSREERRAHPHPPPHPQSSLLLFFFVPCLSLENYPGRASPHHRCIVMAEHPASKHCDSRPVS